MRILKKLLMFAFVIQLLSAIVIAVPMPSPVAGDVIVNGVSVNGYSVKAENLRTGEIIDGRDIPSMNTENGKFMFDLGQFSEGYNMRYNLQVGDTIKVSVCDFDSACVQQFEIVNSNPVELKFIINNAEAPVPCPVCQECKACVVCSECTECPVCQDCVTCPVCQDCPSIIWAVLLSLIGAGSIGVGIKIYKGRTGTTSIQHIHPGITGYHNPDTVHSNLNIRHPKGEKVPKYEKDISGIWHYKK